MIGYLEGKLLKKESDKILLLVGQVGYEVTLPGIIMKTFHDKIIDDKISLYIYYVQTERQPRPVLIGFNHETEKDFFQLFISVEGMGPLKASKALDIPFDEIAFAIENKDIPILTSLKGVGKRMAQKIIASLEGRMGSFTLINKTDAKKTKTDKTKTDKTKTDKTNIKNYTTQVLEVLITQLGFTASDAKKLINDALEQNASISSSEELFDAVLQRDGS